MRPTKPADLPSSRPPSHRDRGNAYLITVMVMVIVTLLGLSIGAVSQTEMLIGSRERNNQRVFYLAETGLNLAVARFMASRETRGTRAEMLLPPAYDFSDDGGFGGIALQGVLRIAPVMATAKPPCNLCSIGGSTEANPESLFNMRYAITVRAQMESQSGQVLAQRRVSSLLDIQPWRADEEAANVLDSLKAEVEYN